MAGRQRRRVTVTFDEYPCFRHTGHTGGDRSLSSLWQLFNSVPVSASPAPHVPDTLFRNRE